MIQTVRMAVAADWCPERVELQARASDWKGQRPEIAGEAWFEFDAPRTAIELPPGSLRRRLIETEPSSTGVVGQWVNCERPALDLKGSLHQVLKSVACESTLPIEIGENLLETSERSLRRYLAAEGATWREIVDEVRLEIALELIDDPTNSLRDVAKTLGYSQYPHFNRAFNRWTGVSPREYRKGRFAF